MVVFSGFAIEVDKPEIDSVKIEYRDENLVMQSMGVKIVKDNGQTKKNKIK